MKLPDLLRETATRHGHRLAVTDLKTGEALTYARLLAETETVAEKLRQAGVEPGQRVGLMAGNDLAYLPAAFAILDAGACLTPIAAGLAQAEIDDVLREVGVNGVLFDRSNREPIPHADGSPLSVGGSVCQGFGFRWIDRALAAPAGFAALDPAFIRFTSGTTAERKGVILSHAATRARAEAAGRELGLGPHDRVLFVLPLAYHFAVTITSYIAAAVHLILCPDALPTTVLEALRSTRATLFYASPYHVLSLAGLAQQGGRLGDLRLVLSTTAPLPPEAAEAFEGLYQVPVGQAYGIIEAGLPCINRRQDDLPATSVGPAVPGYEVQVWDENNRSLAQGEAGEVVVKGPGMFSGYYLPWRPLDECLRGGWFLTGDIGILSRSGALQLVGRKKSVLIVAGMKVFPEEVEAVLNRHPGIRETRVIGRSHPRLGDVPEAEIVPLDAGAPPQESDLRAHCARFLSPYKIPIAFRRVSEIPKTAGGKIMRR